MASLPYGRLYFGASDSLNEDPDEFLRSFVDLKNAIDQVKSGSKFLVLGPKGTGKSAVARFVSLTESEGTHVTVTRDASTLPLADIPRIQTGQQAGHERTVVAWKFILLCNYLAVLLRDQSCSLHSDGEVRRVAGLLENFGFTGDSSGRVLTDMATTTWTIPIPKVGPVYQRQKTRTVNIYHLLPFLEEWAAKAQSSQRHLLLLDGLDSIFLNDAEYDQSLSSLVQAAYSLNQLLRQRDATGSIVLLLRYDVFARVALTLPDSQKMRDDLAIDLDWRVLSGSAGIAAPLMTLVNRKAARAVDEDSVDVLSYFAPSIDVGGRTQRRSFPTLQYFLNLTRHTPRDLLRLFEEIRQVEASQPGSSVRRNVNHDVVREGVLQYCTKYFVGAISNEFAGSEAVGDVRVEDAIAALHHIGAQDFNKDTFREVLTRETGSKSADVNRLLRLLFFAGAIGNVVAGRNESYMQFYHRRDDIPIYLNGTLALHNALVHAWNIPRGSAKRR